MATPRTIALKHQERLRELEWLETIKKAELKQDSNVNNNIC
jgi:hypothetical protein